MNGITPIESIKIYYSLELVILDDKISHMKIIMLE